MKLQQTIAMLAICTAINLQVTGQEYLPLPDSNAKWIVTDDSSQGTFLIEFSLSPFSDDTLINSKFYTKIFLTGIDKTHEYSGAFRSSSDGKTFYVPTAHNPPQEYLWYDFSKIAGDTIQDVALNFMNDFMGIYDLLVDSVNYKDAGPYNLKCLYLSPIPPVPPYYNGNPVIWAEGIGSLNMGIFSGYSCGLNMTTLRCMSVDDTIYYYSNSMDCYFSEDVNLAYEPGVCDFYVGDNEPGTTDNKICAYPNPVSDHIIIKNIPTGQMDACIFNAFGQRVFYKRYHTNGNNCIILQSNLIPGVYLISLTLKNKELWNQKIIVK